MSDTDVADLLLQCIARLARADGRVTDGEIREIGAVVHELTGMAPTPDIVRGVLEEVGSQESRDPVETDAAEGDRAAISFIAEAARGESLDLRLLIARASYRVLASDGEITGSEVETFNALLRGLDLSPAQVMRLLD